MKNLISEPRSGNAASLRLHGYPVSNYFNIVHAALIEKEADFELVIARARQDDAFLAMSPMGKIPFLETSEGFLAETVAILEYLEDRFDGPSLYPADPFVRAKARQVINVVQMYVEAQIRLLFPGVFFGGANSVETVEVARAMLDRATGALRRLTRPRPWLVGDAFGNADIFAFYCLDIAERVTGFVYGRSILTEAGLTEWRARVAARDSSRIVLAAFAPAFEAYLRDRNAAWREPASTAPTREQTHA